jgi:glutamate racemase
MAPKANSAIGVFDSGVGGLTVLRALKARWPAENFIYLADTARLPYGSKCLKTISHYVEQNLSYLRRYDLKAIVVACNSASTALLEWPIEGEVPVFNVIEPGARKAVEISATGRIGVLGTRATILGEAYPRAIRKLKGNAEIFQEPCPLFVPLVEEGWLEDPVTELVVERYVGAIHEHRVDTLILGCTHYPALRACIQKAAGPGVTLVDSSEGLIEDLTKLNLAESGPKGRIEILCTDFSPRLEETIRMLLGGAVIDKIEAVDI